MKMRETTSRATRRVTASELYAAIPKHRREVKEAQFRRNMARGLSPELACRRRASLPLHGWIYRITHLATGREYYGATTTPGQQHRWEGHVADARRGRGSPGSLEEAIRAEGYRRESFSVEPIEWCSDPQTLAALERYYILHHRSLAPHGMNLDPGGSLGCLLNRKSLVANGVRYGSILEACLAHRVSPSLYHARRRLGYSVAQALGIEPAPARTDLERFTIDGIEYFGKGALAKAFGVNRATVVTRLRNSWTPRQAVGLDPSPEPTRSARRLPGMAALSRKSGVPLSTIRHRVLMQKMSVYKALRLGKQNGGYAVAFTHRGRKYGYPSRRSAAAAWGVKYVTLKRRLAQGATIKQALEVEPLPSRRRRRPRCVAKARAKPCVFGGRSYPSRSALARALGCEKQCDINWAIGLIRQAKTEEEVRRLVTERLGRFSGK